MTLSWPMLACSHTACVTASVTLTDVSAMTWNDSVKLNSDSDTGPLVDCSDGCCRASTIRSCSTVKYDSC